MPLKKNTSPHNEDTSLLTMFTAHFGDFLNLARIRFVCHFIGSLCKVKTVNYSKLSAGFNTNARAASNFRRIQRFMASAVLPMEWVAKFIFALLPHQGPLILVMDRTNWKLGKSNINILMLGIAYKNVAFPLMFRMLDKRGNSSTCERIAMVRDFISWFGRGRIDCLLADREFVGEHWLDFLNQENIRYHIRIRNNFKVFSPRKQKKVTAWHLFNNLSVGEFKHYQHIVRINQQLCYLSGTKMIKDGKIQYLILVSFNRPDQALEYYGMRWQVETLFRGLKSSGFNIEDTHVIALHRLEKLMMLVIMAFVWCYRIGDFIDTHIQPIKIKKHGRRAVSVCKYGLDYLSRVLLTGYNELNINVLKFLSCT